MKFDHKTSEGRVKNIFSIGPNSHLALKWTTLVHFSAPHWLKITTETLNGEEEP